MRIISRLLAIAIFVGVVAGVSAAPEYPKAVGYVNDFAGLLSAEQRLALETELRGFEARTTAEIAVVTVTTLQGYSAQSYTLGLANTWHVGKAEADNGVVLLIAPAEHKVWIEPGRGVRAILTTYTVQGVVNNDILPQFPEHMDAGIINGVHALMVRLEGGADAPAVSSDQSTRINDDEAWFILLVIFGGLVSISGIVYVVNWSVDKFGRKRENLKLASELRSELDLLHTAFEQAKRSISTLQADYLPVLSEHVRKNLKTIDLDALESEYSAAQALCNGSWFAVDEARKSARLFGHRVDAAQDICAEARNTLKGVREAQSEVPRLIESLPAKIASALASAAHEDVLPETRKNIETASRVFVDAKSSATERSANNVDWFAVHSWLKDVSVYVEKGLADIESNKELAIRARVEGPKLLRELPDLLAKAEKKAGASPKRRAKLEEARAYYNQANLATQNGTSIDWLIVYALLMNANSNASAASAPAVSQSSFGNGSHDNGSSATSSSNHSFDVFGGFGGGDFGGGGAGGSW